MEKRHHKKYVHYELRLLIFRLSFYMLGLRKLSFRFEISWGWDDK